MQKVEGRASVSPSTDPTDDPLVSDSLWPGDRSSDDGAGDIRDKCVGRGSMTRERSDLIFGHSVILSLLTLSHTDTLLADHSYSLSISRTCARHGASTSFEFLVSSQQHIIRAQARHQSQSTDSNSTHSLRAPRRPTPFNPTGKLALCQPSRANTTPYLTIPTPIPAPRAARNPPPHPASSRGSFPKPSWSKSSHSHNSSSLSC